jgi:YfiH family protein
MPVETIISEQSEEQILTDAGFYWRERDGVRVLICKPLEDAGFVNGFSTRVAGVSDFPKESLNLAGFDEDAAENIHENRRRFLNALDGDYELATVWQVHGDTVKTVKSVDEARSSEDRADAIVSDLPNTLAGVKTADCVPILIGDPKSGAFAAVHAGWKGTAARIVVRAIEAMVSEFGADPKAIIAAIGPCASGENYEVGEDVIERFRTAIPGSEKYFSATRPGHALVDLRAANRDLLINAGVSVSNIFIAPFCTIARTELFFSYRVEKKVYGKTGRLLSVIGRADQRNP